MTPEQRREQAEKGDTHDSIYAPRRDGESAEEFLKRALTEHRKSHEDWVRVMRDNPDRGSHEALGDLVYQERSLFRYDEMLIALAEAQERIAELEKVFKWLLGEEGDFPPREPGKSAFHWRKHLREKLAALKGE